MPQIPPPNRVRQKSSTRTPGDLLMDQALSGPVRTVVAAMADGEETWFTASQGDDYLNFLGRRKTVGPSVYLEKVAIYGSRENGIEAYGADMAFSAGDPTITATPLSEFWDRFVVAGQAAAGALSVAGVLGAAISSSAAGVNSIELDNTLAGTGLAIEAAVDATRLTARLGSPLGLGANNAPDRLILNGSSAVFQVPVYVADAVDMIGTNFDDIVIGAAGVVNGMSVVGSTAGYGISTAANNVKAQFKYDAGFDRVSLLSNDATDLVFGTNNVVAIAVDTNQNVGIGGSPSSELLNLESDAPIIRLRDSGLGTNCYINGDSGTLRLQSHSGEAINVNPGGALAASFGSDLSTALYGAASIAGTALINGAQGASTALAAKAVAFGAFGIALESSANSNYVASLNQGGAGQGILSLTTSGAVETIHLDGLTGTGKFSIVDIDNFASTTRQLNFQTSGLDRWRLFANSLAEAGANAGSDFAIARFDDAGVLIDTPFSINRATGVSTFASDVDVAGNILNTVKTGDLIISGSDAPDLGGNIIVYGDSHATRPGSILFRQNATEIFEWDAPNAQFDFKGRSITAVDAITLATGFVSNGILSNNNTDSLVVSGSNGINKGANLLLFADQSGGNAYDWAFRADQTNRVSWDNSALTLTVAGDVGIVNTSLDAIVAYSLTNDAQTWSVRNSGANGNKFEIRDVTNGLNAFTVEPLTGRISAAGGATYGGSVIVNVGSSEHLAVLRSPDFARIIIGRSETDGWDFQDASQELRIRQLVAGTPVDWLVAGTDLSATFAAHIGLDKTPRTDWHADYVALHAGNRGVVLGHRSSQGLWTGSNWYYDGQYRYMGTAPATQHFQTGEGKHIFRVAASGTPGAVLTWTDALTVNNDASMAFAGNALTAGANTDATVLFDGRSNRSVAGVNLMAHRAFWNGTEVARVNFRSGADTLNKDDGYLEMQVAEGGMLSTALTLGQNRAASFAGDVTLNQLLDIVRTLTTLETMATFTNGNGQVGSITTNGMSTAYNTSSDYRLKTREAGMIELQVAGGLFANDNGDTVEDVLTGLGAAAMWFTFKKDPGRLMAGWNAHEFGSFVPEGVQGAKDAIDEHGDPVPQQIDQAKAVPYLAAGWHLHQQRIAELEARVAHLEQAAA